MRLLLTWLVEQRSGVAIGLSVAVFAITLILRYGYDTWWPHGIFLATLLGVVGLIAGFSEK